MKRCFCGLLLCVLGVALSAWPALAGRESYALKDGKVYQVDADGKRKLLEDAEPGQYGTDKGVYSWILVDPELSDAMKGSKSGIYFFDESEKPQGFLPFDGAAYCSVTFSPDAEKIVINFGTDSSQEIMLYTFKGFEKEGAFRAVGSVTWLDPVRFVFTRDDASKGSRAKTLDQQEGWLSVMIYDTAIKELISVMEATETKDYMLTAVDEEESKLKILERSVKDKKDWGDGNKIQDTEISAPIPAAG